MAYIAGKAPCRWGPFGVEEAPAGPPLLVVPPSIPPPNATAAELARAAEVRRSHPLYADVSLRLLTEIMNSRLFTTVRTSPGGSPVLSCLLSTFPASRMLEESKEPYPVLLIRRH